MIMLPVPFATFSLKVIVKSELIRTFPAPSKGDKTLIAGPVTSSVVKFHVNLLDIPANGFEVKSCIALLSIKI